MSHLTPPPNSAPQAAVSDGVSWTDPARQAVFDRWMSGVAASQDLLPDSLRVASADASFRRYLRVDRRQGGSLIVMDAPPDKENSEPFVRIAALMKTAGLNAPEVLDWHEAHGFMLLSDLGDATMMSAIDPERPQANHDLYMQAVDTLVQWQLASRPGVLPPYDTALLNRELSLFPDWYLAQHRGVQLQGAQREVFDKAFALIVQRNLANGLEKTLVAAPRSPRPDLVLGTAFRPAASPDGRWIAFGGRAG